MNVAPELPLIMVVRGVHLAFLTPAGQRQRRAPARQRVVGFGKHLEDGTPGYPAVVDSDCGCDRRVGRSAVLGMAHLRQ